MPAFAVQPVVENAVQHGMKAEGVLHIQIIVRREANRVIVEILDDGAGMPAEHVAQVLSPGFGKGLGIALKNVEDRLKGHYGPDSGLVVTSQEGAGTTVRITVADKPGPL